MSTFEHAPNFDVKRCDGPILTLLECDSLELQGTGWKRFMHPEDFQVAEQIRNDMEAGRGGSYVVRQISKTGDQLTLNVRTYAVPTDGSMYGRAILADIEYARKFFPITRLVQMKG